ncbi:MAG: ATP-binding protein, partial [Bacteroidota bacterium]
VGQGIVGTVAQTGKSEIVSDTTVDTRYIADDEVRLSEIAVPLVYQEQVLGVIDAEHPDKNFFTEEHLTILEIIAALCSNKIIKARAEDEHQQAEAVRQEAERIKALDEAKSQFFANVTHEFRTPLTLIIGPLEQKLSSVLPDEERQTTERMLRHAQRLLRLINQLLDFAKLEQQPLQLSVQPGSLTHFLQSLFASFEWQAQQQQVDYQIHWPSQEITGYFDVDKLDKIVYNLLSNAFKFTPRQGKVVVIVVEREKQLEVQVRNSGKGIPPDQLPHIFERFYQAKQAENSPSGGTGIGLALIQELVTIHQGSITVESIPNQETVFTVSIPIDKAEYKQTEEVLTDDSPPGFEPIHPPRPEVSHIEPETDIDLPTLLLVEDHHDLRAYVREQTASDYQVLEAVDGVEGWKAAIAHSPDLIICDWMMPRLDGRTLCERLKTDVRTSHIPVIMLTARADQTSRLAGLETGADVYLVKPFNPEELRLRIRKLVEQRIQLRSHFQQELIVSPQEIKVNSTDERFLQQAVALIDSQLANPNFTVAEWQQELNLSRMHLHRKLKALTGQSATEFIRTYRLKRAAQLLAQRADNVSQIAYQVGFSSLAYFTTSFKTQFGCNPSEYAEKAE